MGGLDRVELFTGDRFNFRGGEGWGFLETPPFPRERKWDCPLRPRRRGTLFGRLPLAEEKAQRAEQ
jgi:hypothetical protein